jgi:hypothetical protein
MKTAFGTDNVDEVIKIILEKGELQVSGGERDVHHERSSSPCPACTAQQLPVTVLRGRCLFAVFSTTSRRSSPRSA